MSTEIGQQVMAQAAELAVAEVVVVPEVLEGLPISWKKCVDGKFCWV